MNPTDQQLNEGELALRREELRRGLRRTNVVVWLILVSLLALAVGSLWLAQRARQSARVATRSAALERTALRQAYLAQARAGRLSGLDGQRRAGLTVLASAAKIQPGRDLRDEYLAHLSRLDFEPAEVLTVPPEERASSWLNPQFDRLAIASAAGAIKLLTLPGRRELWTRPESGSGVEGAQFSPDGALLAVVFRDRRLRVLQAGDGREVFERADVGRFRFAGDGRRFLLQTRDQVPRIYELSNPQAIRELEARPNLWDAVFSPGANELALTAFEGLEIWDVASGKRVALFPAESPVVALDWRGDQIAAGEISGGVQIFSRATGQARRISGHTTRPETLFFDPDGGLLVSSALDNVTRVWSTDSGELLVTVRDIRAEGFDPAGRRMYGRIADGWQNWRPASSPALRDLRVAAPGIDGFGNVSFSSDSARLAVPVQETLRFWRTEDGLSAGEARFPNGAFAWFLEDAQMLLVGRDGDASRWRIDPLPAVAGTSPGLSGRQDLSAGRSVNPHRPGVSANGRRLALQAGGTNAIVIDLGTADVVQRIAEPAHVSACVLSPDGRWLVNTVGKGGHLHVWDVELPKQVHQWPGASGRAAFSPDGRLLAIASPGSCQLVETGTWRLRGELSGTGLPGAGVVAFSGDGQLLAWNQAPGLVQLVAVTDRRPLASLPLGSAVVLKTMEFSPDGRWLAAGDGHGVLRLWDLPKLRDELSAAGLDWGAAGEADDTTSLAAAAAAPASFVQSSSFWFVVACGGMVVVGVGFIRIRQERLHRAYLELDGLAERRMRELQAARVEVLHSQKMKALGTLAAGIAHDFNNLLSVVRMSNKLIARETADNPAVRENAEEIEQAVQRGKEVVRSMLGYSREAPDAVGTFSVPELVEDTVALLSRQFLSGIVLTLQLDRETPPVTGSRGRLEQVLLNLIVNASEAMGGQGRLLVEVRPFAGPVESWVLAPRVAERHVELVVRDSGPGIAPDILPRIFEPFFTTKNIGTTHGTGLGLLMVYNLAQQDGLGIYVVTSPGEGAAFGIVVPADRPSASADPA